MIKKFMFFIFLFLFICDIHLKGQENNSSIISENNGDIILAYKGFEKYLNSEKNWNDYEKHVLNAFPALMSMHQRYIIHGLIDTIVFKNKVSRYTLINYKPYLEMISEKQIVNLYHSVIQKMDSLLPPMRKVDVCFFLSSGKDAFMQEVSGRQTIYISVKYNIQDMYCVLIHEYAHCIHHQRRPKEPSVLKSWIVNEGIASYFPVLLSNNYSIYNGLWMMPKENVDWCRDHEQQIIDSVLEDFNKSGLVIQKKYIAGGEGFANPPRGFPEKVGYYLGYRIIEKCLNKGIPLSEICNLDSKTIIDMSGILENQDHH